MRARACRAHRPWRSHFFFLFTKEGKKNGFGGNRYCLTSLTAPPRLWLCIRSFSEGAAQPPPPSFVLIVFPHSLFSPFLPRNTSTCSRIVKLVKSLERFSQSAFNSPLARSALLSFPSNNKTSKLTTPSLYSNSFFPSRDCTKCVINTAANILSLLAKHFLLNLKQNFVEDFIIIVIIDDNNEF